MYYHRKVTPLVLARPSCHLSYQRKKKEACKFKIQKSETIKSYKKIFNGTVSIVCFGVILWLSNFELNMKLLDVYTRSKVGVENGIRQV